MQSTSLSRPIPVFSNRINVNSPRLSTIISYPHFTEREYSNRLKEIYSLGIDFIFSVGRTKIGSMEIAGKGCVSLVVKAQIKNRICALKIRRTDADRKSMHREVTLHRIANSAGVGPSILDYSENLVIMEYIDGLSIINWINHQNIKPEQLRNVVNSTMEQCYKLDKAHLDHGELSRLDHHVIVSLSDTANIIDFESSSMKRKVCNVTAAAQSLFLSGLVSKRVNEILHLPERERIIKALKIYKNDQTRNNFDNIMSISVG
ncbi:MAG: RIO1 family regulatory kinase/ATPase [Nitrososphaeraceae archaeon]